MGILRRRHAPQCYYCLTPCAEGTTAASSRWCCPACGCWNVRDAKGSIVSEHPAMRDSELNRKSFALRARPDTSQLPSSSRASPFCRDCQTNQTLVMNLLSNYLPEASDPSYPLLAEQLPNYIASLHARYPPVCAQCQPGVDEALRRADQKAQTEAWSRALLRGMQVVKRERPPGPGRWEIVEWQLRGVAWCADAALVAAVGLAAWLCPPLLMSYRVKRSKWVIVSLRVLAIRWAFWDPLWLRRARRIGQTVAYWRRAWVWLMFTLYLSRLLVACVLPFDPPPPPWLPMYAAVDLMVVLVALTQLRLAEPVALTLVRPIAPAPQPHHIPPEPSLQALSLGSKPTLASQPVFGEASLPPLPPADEPMDWEPSRGHSDWDSFPVGKQPAFAPPGSETGLESLLAGWGISAPQSQPPEPAVLPIPKDMAASRPILGDSAVRNIQLGVLALRVLALTGAVGCRFVGISINDLGRVYAGMTLNCLLGMEVCASTLALVVALATGRVRAPLSAIVLGCDAAVRLFALQSPPLPSLPILHLLSSVALETACVGWTVLDAVVLFAT